MNPQPPHPRLYPLLVGLIYERSKIGILATVVNASILVFILWEEITHWILALWYIIILLISLIRYILNQRFLGRADQTQDIRRWGQILLVGLAIPGLLWGATGIFLFPVHSVAHQVFIAFVLAGMVAGAVGVFSPIMPVFLVFSIPALVPITIRFILIGDQLHMAMGAMITLFAILTFMTAQRVGTSIRELVVLKETFADLLEERTQKVRAREQSLRESEQRLMIAKQAAALGIYDYHLVSGVLTWDDRMRELWGIGPDYPVSYDLFMSGLHPDDRSSTQADVEKAFDPKGDGKHSAEYRVISRADDTERWVGATGTTFFENGKAVRFVGTVQDITGRKKAEEELRQLNENLEQTVQERTEKLRRLAIELTLVEQRERKNLGRILHDGLQQYLVAAKMQINGLMSNLGDAGLRQSASGIENLLSEAVQVSRSLAAELSPPILRDAGILAGLEWLSRWMSEKHGLQVQLVMNMDAPSLSESVKILLFESIREMLLNVVKHAESKSAKILLFRAQVDHLGITVSDAGKGFETKNASESCYQKGFGLFSIQERMQLIGGKLEIESTPGKGCRITLTAPLEPPEAIGRTSAKTQARPSPVPPGISDGKIRILIAHDHVVIREGLARLLSQEPDFEVIGQVTDGQEAIESVASLQPDLILMDIGLPVLDGIEATRIIHQQSPHLRIIGLSLYTEDERAKEMLAVGAYFYMSKSGPPAELKAAIRSCCGETSQIG